VDDRERSEYQRLIAIVRQARAQADAIIASSREAIARSKALIQSHATRHEPKPSTGALSE
jgi:hypothetical protein